MKDKEKTKEQLINELTALRQQITELKATQTERKKAEERLKQSERDYRGLFESAHDAIIILDSETEIVLDANQRACSVYGYDRSEFIGMSLELISKDIPRGKRHIKATLDKGSYHHFETTQYRKDGSEMFLEINASVVDYRGQCAILSINRDVSERKKAEAAYRTLVENSLQGLAILEGYKVTFANPALARMLGYTVEELLSFPAEEWKTAVHPQDQTLVFGRYRDRLKGKPVPPRYEFRMVRKDGMVLWVEMFSTRIEYDGKPAIQAAFVDITERKRAEEALRENEEKFRNLAEQSPNMIFINKKGRVVYANKKCEEIMGYKKEEFCSPDFDFLTLISPEFKELIKTNFSRHMKGKEVTPCEYVLITKKGKKIEAILTTKLIKYKGESAILGTVTDITERKRMEEELLKAKKLESLGTLAGGIAHDFNNILTGILGNISLAETKVDSKEEIFKILKKAEKASLRAKDLTQQLLTFSRGGAPIRKATSIVELIKDSVSFALRDSKARCEFSISDELWPVEIDEGQISQVINNLTFNANQAMPQGGTIKVGIENVIVGAEDVLPLQIGKYVKIAIEDNGVGISEQHLEKVFDPYFTTKHKGNGLGLTTSYSIIKNHNGYITVESEPGVGTTFSIYLPASFKKIPKKKPLEESSLFGEGNKILVMDDEELVRDVIGDLLEILGYKVEFAEDGAEAIELYKKAKESAQPFDAVIMDLTVPGGMGGKESIQKLLQVDPQVKAIVSSGYSNDPVMADFRKYGFSGVVAKPFKLEELSEVLRKAITGMSKTPV